MFEKESKSFADSLEEDAEIGIDNSIDVFFRDTIEYAFQQGAILGITTAKAEVTAKFNQIDKLVDKLYLSGLTAKQIAVVEQIQDLINMGD